MAEENVQYLYRFRSWDRNIWCGVYQPELTAEQIESAWGKWEFIDEQKYNEICGYIAWDRPCHYQAEKLLVTVVGYESFDPVAYIEQEKISIAQARKDYQDKQRKEHDEWREARGFATSQSSQSAMPVIDTYSLGNLAEGVVQLARNAINGTVETVSDCASAIGDGLSDLCD